MTSTRPRSVLVAATVTSAMAAAIAAVAVWDLLVGGSAGPRLGTNLYYIIVAVLLVPASLALLSGRAWPRAVLVTAHLLVLLSMIAMASVLGWFAAPVAVLSAAALIALAMPSARAFGERRGTLLDD